MLPVDVVKQIHMRIPSLLSHSAAAFGEVSYGKTAFAALFANLDAIEELPVLELLKIWTPAERKSIRAKLQVILKHMSEGRSAAKAAAPAAKGAAKGASKAAPKAAAAKAAPKAAAAAAAAAAVAAES